MSSGSRGSRVGVLQLGAVGLAAVAGLIVFSIARPEATNPPGSTLSRVNACPLIENEAETSAMESGSPRSDTHDTSESPAGGAQTTVSRAEAPQTTPPQPPSVEGSFGAGAVGPAQEQRTTQGLLVEGPGFASSIESAKIGSIILLRGGDYSGGLLIPRGVTVKPYNGESVMISGSVTMDSMSVLAGVDLRSSGQWAIRVDSPLGAKSDITIRNNIISGGSVETIRVSRNVSGVYITGNDISGGGNHSIKVHGEALGHAPSAIIRGNRIHDPFREDGIQTEDHGRVTIDRNTFYGTPENAIDVKTGQMVAITNNLFDGTTIRAEALLVHGHGFAVAVHNHFADGADIALGSNNSGNPMMTLRDSRVDGGDIVIRRSTQQIAIGDNVVTGGTLKLGIAGGDHPADARVTCNVFEGTELLDRVTPTGDSWACTGNTLIGVIGDWSSCT